MHDTPFAIYQPVHFCRVPRTQLFFFSRLINNKGIEVVAQNRQPSILADNDVRVEIFVPHDVRILIELRKMRQYSRATDELIFGYRVEITDAFMVILKIPTAVATTPAFVQRDFEINQSLGDFIVGGFHFNPLGVK
ncbi:hypothetical protein WT05_15695 [Burkholderia stagnalis]|nr:hypothetical protein WT05_15695 [Burkholderia stagnalis]